LISTVKTMLHCINNSKILRASLELLSNDDFDIKNEFKIMCTRFGLNEPQMISLVTTLDISLLNDHYETIWDGLNYYSMACMDDYKKAYVESLYETDLMDDRIYPLCYDLREYIKCNSCINFENGCRTFKNACDWDHDVCVKYLLNNPQKHDVENDIYDDHNNYGNTNIIDYICLCGGSLDVIKYLFENQKKDCTDCAIDYASKNGNLSIVKYLFEIQNKDCTDNAIDWGCHNGHLDVIKYLFEIQKKDCSCYAIYWAIARGHLDIVKYLFEIQNKDCICTNNAIDCASSNGHLDIVKYLFEIQKKNCTNHAIDDACRYGYLDIVKYLFEIQKKNFTNYATGWAKENGHWDILEYLSENQKNGCTT